MRRFGWLAAAVLIGALVAHPARGAAPEAVLVLDAAALSVELRDAAGLSVPACRGVDWQRFDATAGRFLSIPQPGCGAPAAPLQVTAEGLRIVAPARVAPGQTVRAVVVLGEGCAPGLPIALASCRAVRALESKPLTIPQPEG